MLKTVEVEKRGGKMGKIKTGFGPEGLGGVSTKHDKEGGAGMVARRETPQKPRKTGPNLLGTETLL